MFVVESEAQNLRTELEIVAVAGIVGEVVVVSVEVVGIAVFPSGSVLTDPGPFNGPFFNFGSVLGLYFF